MRGLLLPTSGDWCQWRQTPALPCEVQVRIGVAAAGRLVLTGLMVDGVLTAELLRSIRVGQIEAVANAQLAVVDGAIVPATAQRTSTPSPVPDSPAGWELADPAEAVARPGDVARPEHVSLPGPRTGPRTGPGSASADRTEVAASGRGRPDSFYAAVADEYRRRLSESVRPVAELAEANGVPVTTAYRWIKEARRRGLLPPGRPGKVG